MIGHLTSPKLDPLPADFEKSVLRFFIELGKQVRGWWSVIRVCSSTPKKWIHSPIPKVRKGAI